jgi:hypothetical protein
MSYDYTITGFFDSDRFKIDLGLQSPFSVDNTVVFARPKAIRFCNHSSGHDIPQFADLEVF